MAESTQKPSLHASQLLMLSRCACQYEFRYVQGIIIPPAAAMLVGTATHKGVEANLQSKIDSGKLLSREAVVETAIANLRGEWSKGVGLSDDEKALGEKRVQAEAIDDVARLSDLHARELAPVLKPTHVERTFRVELKGYPVDLVGTIDILEADAIRDTKTSKRSPNGDAAERSEQLSVYALATRALEGEKAPTQVALDYLVKTKEPKVVTLKSERNTDDMRATLTRVEIATEMIEAGIFYPTNPENWWCSKDYCGYYDRCPFGARKRVSVAGPK